MTWRLLSYYCGTTWGLLTLTDDLMETTKGLLENYSGTPWGQLGHYLDSNWTLLGHYMGTASRFKLQLD